MPDPIPCRDAKGHVVFQIDAAGRLLGSEGVPAEFHSRSERDSYTVLPRTYMGNRNSEGGLILIGVTRSIAGDGLIFTFRVGDLFDHDGDYLRCQADGTWDLWRPAGTRVERAYVAGGAR